MNKQDKSKKELQRKIEDKYNANNKNRHYKYYLLCIFLHVQSRTKTGEMWTVPMSMCHLGTSDII